MTEREHAFSAFYVFFRIIRNRGPYGGLAPPPFLVNIFFPGGVQALSSAKPPKEKSLSPHLDVPVYTPKISIILEKQDIRK